MFVFICKDNNVKVILTCALKKKINNYYEDSTTGKQNAAKYLIYNGIRTNCLQQLLFAFGRIA
jgi:hypothetical protein